MLDRLEKTYLDGLTVRSASGQDFEDSTATAGVQVTLEHVRWVLALYACCLSLPLLVLAGECVVAWRARARAARRTNRRRGLPAKGAKDAVRGVVATL